MQSSIKSNWKTKQTRNPKQQQNPKDDLIRCTFFFDKYPGDIGDSSDIPKQKNDSLLRGHNQHQLKREKLKVIYKARWFSLSRPINITLEVLASARYHNRRVANE